MAIYSKIQNKYFEENCANGFDFNGSYCNINDREHYIHIAYKGYVVCLGEHNYYDDSDFYAECWDNEKQKVVKVIYDTTRYASTGCRAEVDATPEVQSLCEEWHKKEERRRKNEELKAYREKYLYYSHKSGLTIRQTLRLMVAVGKNFEEIILVKLLGAYHSNRMRSAYRKSLAEQVITWVNTPEPEYNCPLSPKQLISLLPPNQRPICW